jgi:hypothetical protein
MRQRADQWLVLTVEFAKRFHHLYHCRLILGRVGETEVPRGSDHRSPFSVQSSQSIPTVSGLCRNDGTAFAVSAFWGESAHHDL